jgi:choice-of-anchor A domain-containing protein
MSESAGAILSQFNLIAEGNVNTPDDIEGSAIVGGPLTGATFFNNNVPTNPVVYAYGTLANTQNGLNLDNGGNLYYTGMINPPQVNFNGGGQQITSGPPLPLTDYTTPLTNLSDQLANLGTTPGNSITESGSTLEFNAVAGTNGESVFNISASDLEADLNNNSIQFNYGPGVTGVDVNVTGDFTQPSSSNFNGPAQQDVIFNFENATNVSVKQCETSILAPHATVSNSSPIEGSLFADNFTGGGELHNYTYDGTLPPICFCAGTRILTPTGHVIVEALSIGDLVKTSDGRAAPVRWVGRQTVCRTFADPLRVLPIRIKAGALAENVPSHDLLLSPGHAVLVDTVLIHAGALVNGTSIVRETDFPEVFVYYHIELDDHSLVLAEGTPSETFIDNVDRIAFDNWDEHLALYPEGHAIEEMPFPRAMSHRQVSMAIRRMLSARADAMTDRTTLAA